LAGAESLYGWSVARIAAKNIETILRIINGWYLEEAIIENRENR
jgi:hypothetical protein